jgi:outer membrane protein assembly complex protein YaeT
MLNSLKLFFKNHLVILMKSFLILGLFFCLSAKASERKLDLSSLPNPLKVEIYKKFPILKTSDFKLADLDLLVQFIMTKSQYDWSEILLNNKDVNGVEQEIYSISALKTKRINNVKVIGDNNISEIDIRNALNINSLDIFNLNLLIEGGERVRLLYKEKGFLNAVVDISYPTNEDGNIDVALNIQENKMTMIQKIIVSSENKEFNSTVERKLKKFNKTPFTDSNLAELQKYAKEYFAENRYIQADLGTPEVSSSDQGETQVVLKFKIQRTQKYQITFYGNTYFSNSEINDTLDLNNFTTSSPEITSELIVKIKNLYLAAGFAKVEIKSTEKLESHQFKIQLSINEGARTRIEFIKFSGSFSRSSDFYEKKLLSFGSDMLNDGIYSKEALESALRSFNVDLQNTGYLKARIISTRTQFNREKTKISITINMEEGPQTFIDKVVFEGNQIYNQEFLSKLLKLEPETPLKLMDLENAIQNLKQYYKNSGYLEMMLLNEKEGLVVYNADNTKAQIQFKIYEGPQIRVGSILIDGNYFTKDYVILRELDFKVGDILTPIVLDESINRLQRLGYFNNSEIRTLEEKSSIANRTVIIKVTERDPGLVNFGIGFNNDNQLTMRGFMGIAYRNIRGTGRGISARIEGDYNIAILKYPEFKATVGYLEPSIFDSRVRGRLNHTRSLQITDFDKKQLSDVIQTTLSLEKDFSSHVLGFYDLLSVATVRDFRLPGASPFPTVTQDIASTGPSIDLDFRDHPFNPTKGTFSRFNLEYSSPELGSTKTIEYLRSNASVTHYIQFRKSSVIWANSLRGGYLENLSHLENGGVPYNKKGFILGGSSTIRGFEAGTQESFPNDKDLGGEGFLLKGKSTYYLVKSELRFPIKGNFTGALFYDGGSVHISDVTLPYSYRDSAGIALRFGTPVGPVNFEWAWKLRLLQDRKESPYRFHFSIGTF